MQQSENRSHGVFVRKRPGRARIACSGRARKVLDYIERIERHGERQKQNMNIPLSPQDDGWAQMQVPWPLTEEEWERLRTFVDLIKFAFVADDRGRSR